MQATQKKILINRLGAIGDVVHTTNLFRAIKQAYPNTIIHYMTTKTQACFLENDIDIDKVVCITKNDLKLKNIFQLAKQISAEEYSLVINLQPNLKTRLLFTLANIWQQVNYKKTFKLHAVENFFKTGQKHFPNITLPDKMTLYLSQEAKDYAKSELSQLKKPIIAFNAGGIVSPRQGRTYPVDKWIELGKKLQEKVNGSIIFTGAPEDAKALSVLDTIPNSKSFVGKTTIEQNAAIIANCDLMISGDSGPLHIATALDVPSIGLYGSMPIERTGTYGHNCCSIKSEMNCVPCNRRKCKFLKNTNKIYTPCMEAIDVNIILEKALEYLKLR